MMKPKVTVITVAYNEAGGIEETIQSVLGQSYPDIEYIIWDGGSTDGTLDIIKKYESQIDFWRTGKDKGVYDAMNQAVLKANGTYVNFMNAGDRFSTLDAVEKLFEGAQANADFVYGDHEVRYPSFIKKKKALRTEEMWKDMPFSHQSLFVHTEVMKNHPFQYQQFPISADYHLIYSQYQMGKTFSHVPVEVASFEAGGMSEQRVVESYKEVRSIVSSYTQDQEIIDYHNQRIKKQEKIVALRKALPDAVFLGLMKVKNKLF